MLIFLYKVFACCYVFLYSSWHSKCIWIIHSLYNTTTVFCLYITAPKNIKGFSWIAKTRYIQWIKMVFGSGKFTLYVFIVLHWAEWHGIVFFCSKQAVIMFWIPRQGETNVESVVVTILRVRLLQVLSTVLVMVCFAFFLILMYILVWLSDCIIWLRKWNFSVCSLGPLSTNNISDCQSHMPSQGCTGKRCDTLTHSSGTN